ncbi:MAG TPA: Spy/CpxP family protein refolding chaperone [Candidatus Acidoferrales bacterium]|nr:Spy/CpxP family protein refolding chaperone [Candidatus Acidoferrales bacterium]
MSNNQISWKAVSLVIVLFVLGIALGATGEHLWNAHVIASQSRPDPAKQLKQELQLSPDQAKQFDAIIADERANFHSLDSQQRAEWDPKYHALDTQRHSEWDPKWDQVRQQGRDRIRAILTADQRTKFEAFVSKMDEERRKRQQQQQQQR